MTRPKERSALARTPPDILITTPESLYLLLTSQAREKLRSIEYVIVDEIHALAPTKRGAHLMLSLERLDAITDRPPQRIGLSATQRPLDEIARFLGGRTADGPRPVTIVDAGSRKALDVEVIVPVDDMDEPGVHRADGAAGGASAAAPGLDEPEANTSIWPHVHPRILELIRAHRTTIVFCNARRLAERLAAHLNDLAGEELVRAHHGSLSREQRVQVESELKDGRLRAIIATSSLELGIDMGAVDLVVLVESPGSVARGMQRVGRAGHRVGEPSTGKIFPKYRGDLLEAAVVVERMREGLVEEMRYPRNPLDVLAQQIVAACAVDEWDVDELLRARAPRAANFGELSDEAFRETLDLLAGRYPSDRFAGLRPRVVWDRVAGPGARRAKAPSASPCRAAARFPTAASSACSCPTAGASASSTKRWCTRVASANASCSARRRGASRRSPSIGSSSRPRRASPRKRRSGRAIGPVARWSSDARSGSSHARCTRSRRQMQKRGCSAGGLDERAASNLRRYLDEQGEATGAIPDDRTIVIERFADEIGDWRVCILTPFGSRVHTPWAMAIEERLERNDLPVQVLWSDDGIILRLPEALDTVATELLLPDVDELDDLIVARLPSTSLFASKFRENAARALLLPRRRPGERTPLWQQRQRAADLLEVASGYPTFPMLLETTRECLRDIFDVPALREVLTDIRSRKVRVVPVETRRASPFAQSLLFGWIAVYMYEGDAPLAERRAAALALDRDLFRDLMGAEELRELLDPAVLQQLELELQRLVPERHARHADDLHDLLADLGPAHARRAPRPMRERPERVARRTRGRAARDPRRRSLRRGRGCGPTARRARSRDPAGTADGVHRPGRAPARRFGCSLRTHACAVPRSRRV